MRDGWRVWIRIRTWVFLTQLVGAGIGAQDSLFPFVLPWDDDAASAADLSHLLDPPAGQHGFVRVNSDGHLSTDAGRIRFWGVNMAFGGNFPSHSDAEKIARRMAKFGINIVRFHHMDSGTAPGGLWADTDPDRQLSLLQLDKLDYFMDQLRQNGIYTDLNLLVSRPFAPGDDLPAVLSQVQDGKTRAALSFFDADLRRLQKNYARDLLSHVNPYTGHAYVDEPCVALIEIHNENGLVHAFLSGMLEGLPEYYDGILRQQWNAWLQDRYGSHASMLQAWHVIDEALGNEMLVNGEFADASLEPWILEQHGSPAAQASAIQTDDGPDDRTCVRITIQQPGQAGWHVQWNQAGLNLAADRAYTLEFWARADAQRTLEVELGMAHDPWNNLGFDVPVSLDASWKHFSYSFVLPQADAHARINFTGMGLMSGNVWITGVSLRPGGMIGVLEGENLDQGTVQNVSAVFRGQRTLEAQKDWFSFLLETEEDYWVAMRDHIKVSLGAHSLLVGTIIGTSTPNLMAQFDVIDSHAYWQHPVFPSLAWDAFDWYVVNSTMVNYPDESTMAAMAFHGVLNKPHIISEYNHPVPNTFQAEAAFFLAAYAALQDMDGAFLYSYSHRTNAWGLSHAANFFDVDQVPVKMASMIPAAAAFLRADIRAANQTVVIPFDRETELQAVMTAPAWSLLDSSSAGEDVRTALIHGVRLATLGTEPPADALNPGTTDVSQQNLISDTTEIAWDVSRTDRGVLSVNAERSKWLLGFAAGQTHHLGDVSLTLQDSLQDGFGILALTAMDGSSVHQASTLVLTALGAADNTGTAWYSYPNSPITFPPPDGTAITWHDNQGGPPSRVEGLSATVRLPVPAAHASVWALDERESGPRSSPYPISKARPCFPSHRHTRRCGTKSSRPER